MSATERERARAMASVIELRYASRPQSKTEQMAARRRRVSITDFELLTIIGRGAFGVVRLCRSRQDGVVYAMKTMSKSQLVSLGKVAHVWAERCAMAEAADGNPWVVQLHHAWTSADHVYTQPCLEAAAAAWKVALPCLRSLLLRYMVMDYLPGGDLMSLLMKCGDRSVWIRRPWGGVTPHVCELPLTQRTSDRHCRPQA